jgi:hypothetical protein
VFVPADLDGDGQAEIFVYNNGTITSADDMGTWVLKWLDGALRPVWIGGPQLTGQGWDWYRSNLDWLYVADINGDGRQEVIILNNGFSGSVILAPATCVLQWLDGALQPIWVSASTLTGPGGDWNVGPDDGLIPVDVDGDRQHENLIQKGADWSGGVLKWQDGALRPVWIGGPQLTGPGGSWSWDFNDSLPVADVDGDGQAEIIIYARLPYGDTGLLKWQNGTLQLIWKKGYPLTGPIGDWDRGPADVFVPADVDGDRQDEVVIYNNQDLWTGVLKWNP